MIQAVMLITLGFLMASLIGVLVAPSLWSRAYRLSRKRLERALPLSLSEIEASQDQLRASYAVRLRRLETALASAKQRAALQLVDNSRLQMQIAALKDTIADLDLKLSERSNAATVLEQTITKRFPELEQEIGMLKSQLMERSFELQDLTNRLSRRDEGLEAAQRVAANHEEELTRLRQALEKGSSDRSGRRLRRPSQWTLDDYRSEYDRLNLDLSKLRQQIAQLHDRDAQQVGLIKGDLQKLAELILTSAQTKPESRITDRMEQTTSKRVPAPDPRRDRPVPWPTGSQRAKSVSDAVLAQSDVEVLTPRTGAVRSLPDTPPNQIAEKTPATILHASRAAATTGPIAKPAILQEAVAPKPSIAPEKRSATGIMTENRAGAGGAEEGSSIADSGTTKEGSRKPFSDARELQALSELMAISQGNGAAEKNGSASVSDIADEAKKGQVLDLDSVEIVSPEPSEGSAGQTHNRTLLDRLQNLSIDAKADK